MLEASNVIDLAAARSKKTQPWKLDIEDAAYTVHRRLALAARVAASEGGLCGEALDAATHAAAELYDPRMPEILWDRLDEILNDVRDLFEDAIASRARRELLGRVDRLRADFVHWCCDVGVPLSLVDLGTGEALGI